MNISTTLSYPSPTASRTSVKSIIRNKLAGWLDEQHVESDPVCAAFPDDMRRVMEIFSNLSGEKRSMFVQMSEVFMPQ